MWHLPYTLTFVSWRSSSSYTLWNVPFTIFLVTVKCPHYDEERFWRFSLLGCDILWSGRYLWDCIWICSQLHFTFQKTFIFIVTAVRTSSQHIFYLCGTLHNILGDYHCQVHITDIISCHFNHPCFFCWTAEILKSIWLIHTASTSFVFVRI
jgi:hypothetical protein